jgi:hypothetical protein
MPEHLGCNTDDSVANFLTQNILGVVADLLDHFIELQFLILIGSEYAVVTQQCNELPEKLPVRKFRGGKLVEL